MDVLSKIYAVLTWMVRQGRLVVITGMLTGLAAILVNAIVRISPSDVATGGGLIAVLALVVVVVALAIVMTLVSETFQKENELKYGRGRRRLDDDEE